MKDCLTVMMMDIKKLDWFYAEHIEGKVVTLSDEELRHVKVKRDASEKIAVFDGKGTVGVGHLIKDKVELESIQEFERDDSLVVASAVPKGDRFEWMLHKLTELNVSAIIPMKTRYSVVLPREKKGRWQRILIEACKQCKRAWLPEVHELTDFNDVLKMKSDVKIILDQAGKPLTHSNKKTLVLVGPEGGFDKTEIEAAEKAGFVKASVGKNVLRIETAAVAAAAIIKNNSYLN
jgi:16S rRNA (uracil1498-N3)-methyltransferase